jgi:cell division protease FtsH
MIRANDDELDVREILAELAIDRVFGTDAIKEVNSGRLKTACFVVASPEWVNPVASALSGLLQDVQIFQRKDGKRIDDDSDLAKLRLPSKSVVFVSAAPRFIPPWFLNSAQVHARVPSFDQEMLRALIKRSCRGRLPKAALELNLEALDFDEVTTCVILDSRAGETVERLRTAIERKSKSFEPTEHLPDFENGSEFGKEAHSWGLQLKTDLDDYRRGVIGWNDVDRGAILHGPPGSGKTLYAKSLAHYLQVPFIQTNMAEILAGSGYLDAVLRGQRAAFAQARAKKPSLMFIDEIDQIPDLDRTEGRNRDYWAVVVADFLLALDGSELGRDGVVVLGATNRPEAIAPAVKRKGRLEREVYLGPPGAEGIERIIRHHAGKDLDGVDLQVVSGICFGRNMVAADVMELVRSARRTARREKRKLTEPDFRAALTDGEDWSEEAMTRIAAHEAGHCLAGLLLTPDSLRSVTLSKAHGSFTSFDIDSAYVVTAEVLRKHLLVLLAGRQAEIIRHGNVGTGSGGSRTSDLAKAAAIVAAGMSSYGFERPSWVCEPDDVYHLLRIDGGLRAAVEAELGAAAQEVEGILRANLPALESLSSALSKHRFLDVETMRRIVADSGRDAPAPDQGRNHESDGNRFVPGSNVVSASNGQIQPSRPTLAQLADDAP